MIVLSRNTSFEDGLDGWAGVNGAADPTTEQAHDGAASALVTPSGSGVVVRVEAAGNNRYRVEPGEWLAADGWIRPTTAGKPVALQIAWRNAAGSFLSSDVITAPAVANTWQYLKMPETQAPAGAVFACVGAGRGSSPGPTDTAYVDDLRLLGVPDPNIRVRVGLDHDPDDPALAYTDLGDRLHYGAGGGPVEVVIGRQDEQAEIKPTEMTFALRNPDSLFTPGNPDSDLYGRWEQGRRVQVAEIVDGEEFILGTGFLEIPDMPIVDPLSTQPVTVTAVDRLGRLESAPPYLGTLTEYIRNTDAGPLVEYYPLTDPSHPMVSLITGRQATIAVGQFSADGEDQNGPDLLQPASAEGPPGDDARYPVWSPTPDKGIVGLFNTYPRLFLPVDAAVGAGQVVAVSAWVLKAETEQPPPNTFFSQGTVMWFADTAGNTFLDDNIIADEVNRPGENVMEVSSPVGGLTASRRLETNAWRLITLRIDRAFSRLDLWVGADLIASTVGLPLGAGTVVQVVAGDYFAGSIGHVQVRIGDPLTTMTRSHHLAQHEHGYQGLHRQTVAERLATLAAWAGVPASQVAVPGAASTPMQVAKVADRSPADVMRATAETGQDTLLTNAAGQITVVPRGDRYGQPVALAIPFGWIERRGVRFKPDRPVTDVTVSRTSGGTTKRSDRARAARYGVTGQPYELDTAVDADPGNLADWALAAYNRPRTRTPSLRINMLARTPAERKALLRVKVGDRIELVELPAGQPEDLPDLIVQGIKHTIGPGRRRRIQFNTSPMLGPAPGVPPVGAKVGAALVGPATLIGY